MPKLEFYHFYKKDRAKRYLNPAKAGALQTLVHLKLFRLVRVRALSVFRNDRIPQYHLNGLDCGH